MQIEFRKVRVPAELHSLMAFDRKVFPRSDWFPASEWRQAESWWLLAGRTRAGCCAFRKHVDFLEDLGLPNEPRPGSLYITSTGILPKLQGRGLGLLLKCWQIAYARQHGFERIITNTRKSNTAMIRLNRKLGFRPIRTTKSYYFEPDEATVVLELILQ